MSTATTIDNTMEANDVEVDVSVKGMSPRSEGTIETADGDTSTLPDDFDEELSDHELEQMDRGRARSLSFVDEEEERIQVGEVVKNSVDEEGSNGDANTGSGPKKMNLPPKTIDIMTNLNPLGLGVAAGSGQTVQDQAEEAELALEGAVTSAPRASSPRVAGLKGPNIGSPSRKGRKHPSAPEVNKSLSTDDYDYYVKVLLLGDSGVGKTSLMLRFADNQFQPNLMSTAGVDFKVRYLKSKSTEKRTKCQIWDTAGQERFHVITRAYYRGAHGIALTYDAADEGSFKQIGYWMDNIKKHAGEDVAVIILGNKVDLPNKKISYEQGKAVADQYGVYFSETSAKTGKNVVEAFETLTDFITKKWPKSNPQKRKQQSPFLANS